MGDAGDGVSARGGSAFGVTCWMWIELSLRPGRTQSNRTMSPLRIPVPGHPMDRG